MKFFTQFFLFLVAFIFFFGSVFAEINMTVSPIKYEINANPGDIITQTATLYNYSAQTLNITTSKAEFQADGTSGQPKIVSYDVNNNSVASWITLHTQEFSLAPNIRKTISFDVLIPDDAQPGGHYAAVLFENHNASHGGESSVGVNVDYGVLLLITVSGDVIVEGDVDEGEIIVRNSRGSGWGGGYSRRQDTCPLGDFSKSNFDNKCIDDLFVGNNNKKTIGNDKDNEILTDNKNQDFENNIIPEELKISFDIPFENKGNTHIRPTGKITLKDENGKQIKGIGEQIILNHNGAIIGEKIIDFIPINDIGGNVLPQTKRILEGEWKGFPYKTHDNEGREILRYWSPEEYYSKKNIPANTTLNFWERILERSNHKKVTADINIAYTDLNGKEVEFNSAEDFYIEYIDTYIGLNKYIIFSLILGVFILIGFIFIGYRKKIKCYHCGKRIDKDFLICYYCGKKQKKCKKESTKKR